MKFTYYGHSCFRVETGGSSILFDPFIRPNPLAAGVKIDEIQADHIFVTHGHEDHIHDCVYLAERTGALVVSNFEICGWLREQGLNNLHAMNTGGQWSFPFGIAKAVTAQHSSGLPDGSYGGNPMGFVFKTGDQNFYYAGDTALTLDMQLIPSFVPPDLAFLPIGDNFTMGYEDAARAATMIQCRRIIGLHFDTFAPIRIDREQARTHFKSRGLELVLPEIGTTIEL
jgi:L-ascorbate metabolism protein UlaG (beta-lactamase superfamily)